MLDKGVLYVVLSSLVCVLVLVCMVALETS